MADPTLTPREVAELAGTPKHLIERAIEERVLNVRMRRSPGASRKTRRMLPAYAVAYGAVLSRLDLKLTTVHKKRLAGRLARLKPAEMCTARVELAPAVEVDVGRLVGDAMIRAEAYRAARDKFIVADPAIKGGLPVIRGSRVTCHSIRGRIEHGDTIEDILDENPDLPREAVLAALTYARAHPLLGRPSVRAPAAKE
jgi:uncharacterized protein (DUF433 family)